MDVGARDDVLAELAGVVPEDDGRLLKVLQLQLVEGLDALYDVQVEGGEEGALALVLLLIVLLGARGHRYRVDPVVPPVEVYGAVQGERHEVELVELLEVEEAELALVVEQSLELLAGKVAGQVVPLVSVDGVLLVDEAHEVLHGRAEVDAILDARGQARLQADARLLVE